MIFIKRSNGFFKEVATITTTKQDANHKTEFKEEKRLLE